MTAAEKPITEPPVGDRRESANVLNTLILNQINRLIDLQKNELRGKNLRFYAWIGFAVLAVAAYVAMGFLTYSVVTPNKPDGDYIALVRVDGVIAADEKSSANKINPALVRAFKDKKAKGVVLLVNSPGGSPVQASLIHDRLIRLRSEYPDKKVVTVAEDSMTSGAYLIATGTPAIYVNRSTVAGSIGVITQGFGFDRLIHRFDVERRVYTAGEHKNRMDQFGPVSRDDEKKMRELLGDIHQHFIDSVLETRKDKLKGKPQVLFSGDFWTGQQAVELGLADGIADLALVMKKTFGVEHFQDYTPVPSFFDALGDRIPGVVQKVLSGVVLEHGGYQIR